MKEPDRGGGAATLMHQTNAPANLTIATMTGLTIEQQAEPFENPKGPTSVRTGKSAGRKRITVHNEAVQRWPGTRSF